MTQSASRFSKYYLGLMRSDISNYFPKNVFLREPNKKCVYPEITYSVTQ